MAAVRLLTLYTLKPVVSSQCFPTSLSNRFFMVFLFFLFCIDGFLYLYFYQWLVPSATREGRNNSQHCWRNLMGVTFWVCLYVAKSSIGFELCATTPNNTQQHATECQMDATYNIQQCWGLLANNVASVYTGLYRLLYANDL